MPYGSCLRSNISPQTFIDLGKGKAMHVPTLRCCLLALTLLPLGICFWQPESTSCVSATEPKALASKPAPAVSTMGMRLWNDTSGKFSIKAAFVDLADGQVPGA